MAPAVPTTHVKRMNNITPKMFWIHGKKHPMSVPVSSREKTNNENLNFKLFLRQSNSVLDPPRNKIIFERYAKRTFVDCSDVQSLLGAYDVTICIPRKNIDGGLKWAAYPFERRARLAWHRPQRHPVQLVSYWSNWLRIRSSTWFGGVRVSLPAGKNGEELRQKRVRIYAKASILNYSWNALTLIFCATTTFYSAFMTAAVYGASFYASDDRKQSGLTE